MKSISSNNSNRTSIYLHYLGLKPQDLWLKLIELQVTKLRQLASIASARVFLQRSRQSKPAFSVSATLEVPGPDFHAAAKDYTLRAAILKVVDNLQRQIQSRKSNQLARRKSKTRLAPLSRASFSMS